jgi:hypothetical protein
MMVVNVAFYTRPGIPTVNPPHTTGFSPIQKMPSMTVKPHSVKCLLDIYPRFLYSIPTMKDKEYFWTLRSNRDQVQFATLELSVAWEKPEGWKGTTIYAYKAPRNPKLPLVTNLD